jgi:hypothetical protein
VTANSVEKTKQPMVSNVLSYVKLDSGMHAGWIRAFALIAMVALLANAHCYGKCASTACVSAKAPSSSCHQKKSSPADSAPCPHQHSQVKGEAGIAKVNFEAATNLTLSLPTANSSAAMMHPGFLIRPNSGSPPIGGVSSTISVLRI